MWNLLHLDSPDLEVERQRSLDERCPYLELSGLVEPRLEQAGQQAGLGELAGFGLLDSVQQVAFFLSLSICEPTKKLSYNNKRKNTD